MSRVVIYGSARPDGNTAFCLEKWLINSPMDSVVDLTALVVSPFNYQRHATHDDFELIIENLINAEQWLWVTPIYWYSMSSFHKNFLDRLTDLLTAKKALGRKLRGKSMAVLANSASDSAPRCFTEVFTKTADYLGMRWIGMCHFEFHDKRQTKCFIEKELIDFRDRLNGKLDK